MSPTPSPPAGVTGLTVHLEKLGSGTTKAQLDSPQPVNLVFTVALLKRVRGEQERLVKPLAQVGGEISLVGPGMDPSVRLSRDELGKLTEFTLAEPPNDATAGTSAPPRRKLTLAFDTSQFLGAFIPVELALPPETEQGFHHAEISVTLEIAGSEEAAADVNDILDVPLLGPTPALLEAFELGLVDEIGEPIPGVGVSFTIDGEETQVTTDDRGVARRHSASAAAVARFEDVAAIRQTLQPRWEEARVGRRLLPAQNLNVIFPRESVDAIALEPGVRLNVSVHPPVETTVLLESFFDTNKTFLLPDPLRVDEVLLPLYERNDPSQLLIVGHADAAGGASFNDKLSLERAEAVADYLRDNADGWLKWYDSSVPQAKRWGSKEDIAMIGALPDAEQRPPDEAPVRFFQRTRNLKLDGIAGPETRRALITEYMGLDKSTLPATISVTTHGAGENFLEVPTKDGVSLAENRRAELFFFDPDLGIQPKPPGSTSKADSIEYPEWKRRARLFQEVSTQLRTLVIKIIDPFNEPIPLAPYELEVGEEKRTGETNEQGLILERNVPIPNRAKLRWKLPPDPEELDEGAAEGEEPTFERELFLDYSNTDEADRDEAARRRLSNLGYAQADQSERIRQFQRDFSLPSATGNLDQATFDELRRVHDNP